MRTLFFLLSLAFWMSADARPLTPVETPDPLRSWIPWVLQDEEERACPFLYGNGKEHRCVWPSRLELKLDDKGGTFRADWRVYREAWVALPGDAEVWPLTVTLDGQPAVVLERDGRPAVKLAPGAHVLSGRFAWETSPENLSVPPESGLVSLNLNGRDVAQPSLDQEGRLWLSAGRAASAAEEEERLDLRVFRRIDDATPLLLATRLALDVSGRQRELVLGPALPEGFIPLSLNSPLPARLENDGRLRLQVRPGSWTVELAARAPGPVTEILRPAAAEPWPADEIWSFAARREQRLVDVEGAPPLDPSQTSLPEEWKNLPAYRMESLARMHFNLLRRGDPDPEPDQLQLHRELWLDFSGNGYTVRDTVSGRMTRGWRLDAEQELNVGQVRVDGQPQLITRRAEHGAAGPSTELGTGVELRRGALNLVADSRGEGDSRRWPVSGWQQDFRHVSAVLHLPPGWRLFGAQGVDNVPDSWLGRWNLLDLFLVLIVTLAAARLWGKLSGLLALVTLALLWHEPDAPRYVWLHLLAAVALLRVLPENRFARWVRGYRNLTAVALALIAVPFMVDQARLGLYPQLEQPWYPMGEPVAAAGYGGEAPRPLPMAAPPAPEEGMMAESMEQAGDLARKLAPTAPARLMKQKVAPPLPDFDPDARIQTGPGLPDWRWRQIQLSWNGPVEQGRTLRLWLISPGGLLFLNLTRIVLLLALALRLLDVRPSTACPRLARLAGGVSPLFLLLALLVPAPPAGAQLPDDKLLEELHRKVLETPDCLPACAEAQSLHLRTAPNRLTLRLSLHAARNVALPLPALASMWLPQRVEVDGRAAEGLLRTEQGELWLNLPAGAHEIVLDGLAPARTEIRLPLPLQPHRVETSLDGWEISGLHEDGGAENQLQLTRVQRDEGAEAAPLQAGELPPFAEVERTLQLGLEWRVASRLLRRSPPGAPIALRIPLLPGEAVTTPGAHVKDGKLTAQLAPNEDELAWESTLEKVPQLTLQAPDTRDWTESWRVDASPIWHLESEGIPVVHHQSPEGRWLPEWRPWPGEQVALRVTRPEGVPGPTLTVESSQLRTEPGENATDVRLTLKLRSSQGGQHDIVLPESAVLQDVAIDGMAQPIRARERHLTLPVHPGEQTFLVHWREKAGIGAWFRVAEVGLGVASVNTRFSLQLPQDRWLLFTSGPRLGPAVLFWGVLMVLALCALVLSRIKALPLGFAAWLLLLIGLSQSSVAAGALVAGWFGILAWRKARPLETRFRFNALQILLGLYTLTVLALLFEAVSHGLLGLPDMQVSGNGSTAWLLHWYQDRSGAQLPQPAVFSAPLWTYRLLMLAWALWLAWSLLNWLRWFWQCFATESLWKARADKS
ncbi:MAG TPA: hypothetical protein VI457_02810 [Methylococcaceae bacterium]|nr:hypothetical protein [Methylococcaceae bacterium]